MNELEQAVQHLDRLVKHQEHLVRMRHEQLESATPSEISFAERIDYLNGQIRIAKQKLKNLEQAETDRGGDDSTA